MLNEIPVTKISIRSIVLYRYFQPRIAVRINAVEEVYMVIYWVRFSRIKNIVIHFIKVVKSFNKYVKLISSLKETSLL